MKYHVTSLKKDGGKNRSETISDWFGFPDFLDICLLFLLLLFIFDPIDKMGQFVDLEKKRGIVAQVKLSRYRDLEGNKKEKI